MAHLLNPLLYVEMKVRRAQHHFNALKLELSKFKGDKGYTVSTYDEPEHDRYVCRINSVAFLPDVAMILGDLVSCLRAALDQLAWQLTIIRGKEMTERQERGIYFPIVEDIADWPPWYIDWFPVESHELIDSVQPYHRGAAYRGHPLWQLHELCKLDKHRAIPVNSTSMTVHFPLNGWEKSIRHFDDGVEVYLPLSLKGQLKPTISSQIVFGEHMGAFEVSWDELCAMNQFVANEVIRPAARFFAQFVGVR